MRDRYARFAATGPGRALTRRPGLPQPSRVRRYREVEPLLQGPVLLGGDGGLGLPVSKVLGGIGAELRDPAVTGADGAPPANAALVFDATGITSSAELPALFDFF